MNGTLYTWFRRTARRHADTIALEVGAAKLSYAELLELAERLAAKLTAITCGRPPAIALYASRNVAAYVGYLAALRAGAVVVPLAAAAPTMRNHDICRMAGTTLVIADDTSCARAADLPGTLIHLSEDLGWRDSLPPASSGLPYPGRAGDVAYILFTSGSTGRPKGVPIRHRQLAQFLPYCIKRFEVGLGSRFSQTFDLTFDPSVFDMFLAWTGAAQWSCPSRTSCSRRPGSSPNAGSPTGFPCPR